MAAKTVKFTVTTTFSDKSGSASAKRVKLLAQAALDGLQDTLGTEEKFTKPVVEAVVKA